MKNKAIIFLRKNWIFVLIFGVLLYLNIEKLGYHTHWEYAEKSYDAPNSLEMYEEIESLRDRLDNAESYISELQSVSSDNEDRIDENESDIEDIEYRLN